MNEYMPFVTQFLNVFLPPVLVALAGLLAGLAVQGLRLLSAKIKETQPELFDQMQWIAQTAVLAAEQAGVAGLVADKKEYAIEVVEAWLTQYGYGDIDIVMIEAAIEKAVLEEFNTGWEEFIDPIEEVE
jgi:hypothetical protein